MAMRNIKVLNYYSNVNIQYELVCLVAVKTLNGMSVLIIIVVS